MICARVALGCLLVLLAGPAVASSAPCANVSLSPQAHTGWVRAKYDHALIGTVLKDGAPLKSTSVPCRRTPMQKITAAIEATVARGGYVLLGEVHDNREHHLLRSEWLAPRRMRPSFRRARAAAVFEHLRSDQAPAIDELYESKTKIRALPTAPELLEAVMWNESGWPSAEMFAPLFASAMRAGLPIVPGDPSRREVRSIARAGATALPAETAARLGLSEPLPELLQEDLLTELEASHCGLMPKAAFVGMAVAQRYRDAHLADAMMRGAERHGASFLLAGNGHVRRDRGVPYYLRQRAPQKPILTVMLVEIQPGKTDAAAYGLRDPDGRWLADYIVFTPKAERTDACAEMKARMQQNPAEAAPIPPSGQEAQGDATSPAKQP